MLENSTNANTISNLWHTPKLIEFKELDDSIEVIYKETSMITLSIYPSLPPMERVFKIVYSCKFGEWNKSERIYGKILPSKNESYEFEE